MAWKRTDDFDGSIPAVPVPFGWDGKAYTVDLGEAEHKKFLALMQRYLTVAVVYAEMPEPPAFPAPPAAVMDSAETASKEVHVAPDPPERADVPQRVIRAWANQNGYSVGPKGRIPESIVTAYHEAQR